MIRTVEIGRRPRHRSKRRTSPRIGVVAKPGSSMLNLPLAIMSPLVIAGLLAIGTGTTIERMVSRGNAAAVQEETMLREAGRMVVACPALRNVGRIATADRVLDAGEFEALRIVAKRRCA